MWLASSRDQWTTAKLQDTSGASGDFIGNQIEARVRYDLVPGNIKLEAGGTVLFHGEFQDKVASAPNDGGTTYAYTQATVLF